MENLQDKNLETPNGDNSQKAPEIPAETKERYLQQIEGGKQEAQKYRDLAIESEVKRAEVDANSIIDLHAKDPKMADEVAKRFGYDSYNDAETSLKPQEKPSEELSENERFEKYYKDMKAKEEGSNANSEADKILNSLEWDIQTEARKHYEMMAGWRNLSVNQATEMAKMATLYVNKDNLKSDKAQDGILMFGNSGLWSSTPKRTDTKNKDFGTNSFGGKFAHLYK